jgi:hypothetical protein
MNKATSKNSSLYLTLKLTNHSLKLMKHGERDKSFKARNEMLAKLRCVKKTYLGKGFYR